MANSEPTGDQSKKSKFDAQTYLLSYYDDIASIVKGIKYNYVYSLNTNGDTSFPTAMAALTDRASLNTFTQLKTYQYDSLLPNLTLFRVEYDSQKNIKSQKEFIFDKDTKYTVGNMTSPIVRNNCGIKSINWNLAGSNPVTAEKQIEVQVQFYFDSINSFSGGDYDKMISAWANADELSSDSFDFCDYDDKQGGGTTKNYWSLLFHPQQKNDKNKYDTFNYRIKAMVGWRQIEPHFRDSLKLAGAEEDLNRLTYSFFLNLIKHEFTLNEDGSINLTINYVGSFENTTFNYNFNILGSLKEELDKLKNLSLRKVAGLISDVDKQRDILNEVGTVTTTAASDAGMSFDTSSDFEKRIEFNQNIMDSTVDQLAGQQKLLQAAKDPNVRSSLIACDSTPADIKTILKSANTTTAIDKEIELLQKVVDYSKSVVKEATTFTKNQFYSKFINKLLEQNSDNTRYFSVVIDNPTKTNWENWYDKSSSSKPFFTTTSLTNDVLTKEIDSVKEQVNKTIQDVTAGKDLSSITKDNEKATDEQQSIKIVFTTYGCVIDTAYNVIEQELTNNGKTDLINELKRQKIILCNISEENQIFNYNSDQPLNDNNMKNLAFAPIEIGMLKTFLIENIVKPQKDTYPLYSFIKDTLSNLVISVINSFDSSNDEVNKYANISLASNIVTLGDNSESSDPLQYFADLTPSDSILEAKDLVSNKDAMKNYYINYTNLKNHKNYYSYYVIYDKNIKDYKPTNDINLDSQQGIYWYTYGQDYGLIKSIAFSRIDTPYLKEAKAVGKKTFFLGQFRDLYNAELTMIGNNIYYPGMLLHITPSVEASQTPSITKPNFSQVTGIGGYYFVIKVESSISEDGYETKLSTIWHSDGIAQSNSLDEEARCKALLQEAGISSDSSTDSNGLKLMQSLNTFAQAASEQEIKNQELNENLKQFALNNLSATAALATGGLSTLIPLITE